MATATSSKKETSGNTRSKKNTSEKENSSKGGMDATSKKKKASKATLKPTPKTKQKTTTKTKKNGPEKRKEGKAYSITGEMTITTSKVPPLKAENRTFKTAGVVVDSKGNLFHKTSLEITVDNRRQIAVLDAETAELLLKLLRVVEYAD